MRGNSRSIITKSLQDPSFQFSLSLQRSPEEGGPTSVRLSGGKGRWGWQQTHENKPIPRWRLDAEPSLVDQLPHFPSIPALVGHYRRERGGLVRLARPLYRSHHRLYHMYNEYKASINHHNKPQVQTFQATSSTFLHYKTGIVLQLLNLNNLIFYMCWNISCFWLLLASYLGGGDRNMLPIK